MIRLIVFGLAASLAVLSTSYAANDSSPGEVTQEIPTLRCLGVRWAIFGDDNRNATVAVEYRRKGANDWKRALDLFRVETAALHEVAVPAGSQLFAGSILDLDEDTEYEVKLTLSDPDGGAATKLLAMRTWKEPVAPAPKRTLHVVPGTGGGAGTEADPLKGLAAADAIAAPGDLILIHKGTYLGTFAPRKCGTADAPIVWRAAGDGEAILDGRGAERTVSANSLQWVMFEGLSITHGVWGMVAHGASNLTVRRCRFTSDTGFTAHEGTEKRIVVLDSTFQGPCKWPRSKGIEEPEGVELQGEGHVVAYNRIAGMADGISIFRGPSHAIDFYGNDISECTDDGTEMDYGGQNTRLFRNRYTNCFQVISLQPLYGGPCYVVRNAVYNAGLEVLKMHNGPSGFLVYHNTFVKAEMPLILATNEAVHRALFRNNLFIGTKDKYAMEIMAPMVDCDWDYDGFGGGPWTNFGKWNRGVYPTLEAMAAKAGIERHGRIVNPATLFASGLRAPETSDTQYPVTVNDLRLKEGSDAVDAGEALPNINDGFRGKAPDLGAFELGDPLPQYGPRPLKK